MKTKAADDLIADEGAIKVTAVLWIATWSHVRTCIMFVKPVH